jgi:hypothetical protein
VQAEERDPPFVPEQYQVVLDPGDGKVGLMGWSDELTVEPLEHKLPLKPLAEAL